MTARDATRTRSVIVGTTGEGGDGALRAGHALGTWLGTGVTVVSVLEPPPGYLFGTEFGALPAAYDVASHEAREAVVVRQVRDVLDTAVPVLVCPGESARTLAALARQRRAPLLVVGSGRHDVGSRLLLGEAALRIIRRAACPVLVVPDGRELRVPARVAVAAVDFSPSSVAAARAVLPLLADDATLHLVHVGPLAVRHDARAHPIAEDYEQAVAGSIDRAITALGAPPTVTVRPVVLVGVPVEHLLEYAESVDADLVAAGRQGHSLWEHLFVGRVTTGLVRGARCPVLVTPEPSLAEVDELTRRLTGLFEGRSPEAWAAQLDGFARRNLGRRTLLETDDPRLGIQVVEVGHALLGATYDPHDRRVELMLGEAGADRPHLTHSIPGVTTVAVATDDAGPDLALRVAHGDGWTLLTFLPPAPG